MLSSKVITKIEELAKKSFAEPFKQMPGDPGHVCHQLQKDGSYLRVDTAPEKECYDLRTPSAFLQYISTEGDKEESQVFVDCGENLLKNKASLIFVRNKYDRRDVAECELKQSPQFMCLLTKCGQSFRQSDFVRLLRIDLAGCLPSDSELLGRARNLKWTSGSESEGNVQHGRESMGLSIDKRLQGEFPEEITLTIPVFENHLAHRKVRCAIEILTTEQAFRITPLPLELYHALDSVLADLYKMMSDNEKKCPVYFGQP